jgi:hypothetical protein
VIENPTGYGITRDRGATASYAEIERAARSLMAGREHPTVESVRKTLGRSSPNHIATCMQKFHYRSRISTRGTTAPDQ